MDAVPMTGPAAARESATADDSVATAASAAAAAAAETTAAPPSNKKKYRKDKPWDTDDIDHWKIDAYTKEDAAASGKFLEESTFVTLFPKYREHYLREVWPQVTASLAAHGLACVLNLVEGSMTVRTTARTFDPYAIIKARDMMRLLARSMPVADAQRVLEDGVSCDIVRICGIVSNRERFVKRRQRLLGPSGNTQRAIELLTECKMHVQGNTVAILGSHRQIKPLRRLVLDCMNNVHPIYHIKQLMIKRELAKDPKMANENWDRFLPKFKKRNTKSKSKTKSGKSSSSSSSSSSPSLFPPAPQMSKIDKQIESGEYFLRPEEKALRESTKRAEEAQKRKREKLAERAKLYQPPKEEKAANSES